VPVVPLTYSKDGLELSFTYPIVASDNPLVILAAIRSLTALINALFDTKALI